jgi:hypothetical protein
LVNHRVREVLRIGCIDRPWRDIIIMIHDYMLRRKHKSNGLAESVLPTAERCVVQEMSYIIMLNIKAFRGM